MTNTGSISSIAWRMPQRSPRAPMIGRISRPGSTQSEPMEKPSARARGGIAIASAAKMPGRDGGEQRRDAPR